MDFLHPLLLGVLLAGSLPAPALDDATLQKTIDAADSRRDQVLRQQLAKPYPPRGPWHYQDFALAAYWLKERVAEADAAMLAEYAAFPQELKARHWHAALPLRILFLFGSRSTHFPGRMSAEAEAAVLEMLWHWAAPRCRLEMTLPERDWWQWGSENHHAIAWTGFWGAAQLFAEYPAYRERRYEDGTTPVEMAAAFNDYFRRYTRARASQGLLVEVNSGYNKYTLSGWYNLADFGPDLVLRQRMRMLLDLFWADWAIEQINGIRGGSRHRSYSGPDSTEGTALDGLAWYHFGLGTPHSPHPAHMGAATTFWRPSPVVVDLALDVAGRGEYEYLSRRPGRALELPKDAPPLNFATDPRHPFFQRTGIHVMRPEGGSLLRATCATPDFVLGTSMVEALPHDAWNSASDQNRWEGVIFAGHPTSRIFVQPIKPKTGSFYNSNWSVQKAGTLIVQRLRTAVGHGQRIWFDAALLRLERSGWIFAEAPQAFAAVRAVQGGTDWQPDTVAQHVTPTGRTDGGTWLNCLDENTPVILEVARRAAYPTFAAFQEEILANPLRWEKARLDYTSKRSGNALTLFADYSRPPEVNGQSIDYAPRRAYESPFIQGNFGSGLITLQKGGRRATLDFNRTTP